MIRTKRQLTNSDSQLTNDFGEYPLRCFGSKEDRFNDFYIVRTSPINRKLNDCMVIVRGIKSGELLTSPEAKQEYAQFRSSTIAAKREAHAFLLDTKSQFSQLFQSDSNSTKLYIRAAPYVMVPLIALFFLLLAVGLIIFFTFLLLRKAIFKIAPSFFGKTLSTGALGAFIPVGFNGILEIRLFKRFRKGKSDPSEEELISHEHLHLLQHVNFSEGKRFSRICEPFQGENSERLKRHLKDSEDQFSLKAYFFDIKEMEARLHELVLSYYQTNHLLPVSQIEFQEILLSAESFIGRLATALLTEHDADRPNKAETYSVRSERAEIELINTLISLKDEATMRRFFLQVLPVMYANLLILYGYVDQARDFLETIECKDLFLELYGESAIPKPLRV